MVSSRQLDLLHKTSVRVMMGLGLFGTGLTVIVLKDLFSGANELTMGKRDKQAEEELSSELTNSR